MRLVTNFASGWPRHGEPTRRRIGPFSVVRVRWVLLTVVALLAAGCTSDVVVDGESNARPEAGVVTPPAAPTPTAVLRPTTEATTAPEVTVSPDAASATPVPLANCSPVSGVECQGFVTDAAGVLEDRSSLEVQVAGIVETVGHDIAIVLVDRAPGGVESFAIDIGEAWGVRDRLGEAGGVVVVIDTRDDNGWVTAGPNVQDALPAAASLFGAAGPSFAVGEWDTGVESIIQLLGAHLVAPLLMQACMVVDNVVVEDLAQSQVASASASLDSGFPLCRYDMASSATVQVASVPAADWAGALPDLASQIENSVLFEVPENQEKLAQANGLLAAGGDDAGQGACELFSLLVELQGLAPGLDQVVDLIPDASAPVGISAQRCADGIYTSVQLETTGLIVPLDITDRLLDALEVTHAAGVAG